MNGQTILTYLDRDSFSKQIPKHFLYPDTSIYVSKYPSLVIINTDSSKGPGEHWCSAYFDNETVCEYFDPLGFPPKTNNYDFTKTLFPFCNHIIFNKQAV